MTEELHKADTAAKFVTAFKRFYRSRFNKLPIRVSVSSSIQNGMLKPPSKQWVRVQTTGENNLPPELFQTALDVVYPGNSNPMGNINRRMIILHGSEWIEVEKRMGSQAN